MTGFWLNLFSIKGLEGYCLTEWSTNREDFCLCDFWMLAIPCNRRNSVKLFALSAEWKALCPGGPATCTSSVTVSCYCTPRTAKCDMMSACSVTVPWSAVNLNMVIGRAVIVIYWQIVNTGFCWPTRRDSRSQSFTRYLLDRYNIYSPDYGNVILAFSVNGSVETVAFIFWGIGNLILLWIRWDVHIGLKWDNICSFFYFRVKILQWHNRVITSLLKVVTTSIGLRIPATSGSLLNISFIACCIFIFQSSLLNWVFTP